jgi:HK97 family phage prohead protease
VVRGGKLKGGTMETKELTQEVKKIALSLEPTTTKDLGHGVCEFIVSTGSVDRHGEVIDPAGIDTKSYNGIVLYGHDYEGLPIGKAIKVWKDKAINGLKARVQFAIEELPFAKTVYDLIKGGYLTDVSIGGIVNKWSEDYSTILELEMLEFSVVPIGANRDAKVTAKSIGKSLDDIKSEFNDAYQKHFTDSVKAMEPSQLKGAVESIKLLLAALEGEVDNSSTENVVNMSRTKLVTLRATAKEADRGVETVIRTIKIQLKKKEA